MMKEVSIFFGFIGVLWLAEVFMPTMYANTIHTLSAYFGAFAALSSSYILRRVGT